ncbi:hypothetical protein AGIG_G19014 [Arapaima gigas]
MSREVCRTSAKDVIWSSSVEDERSNFYLQFEALNSSAPCWPFRIPTRGVNPGCRVKDLQPYNIDMTKALPGAVSQPTTCFGMLGCCGT